MTISNRARPRLSVAKTATLSLAMALPLFGLSGGTFAAGAPVAQSDQQIGPKFVVIPIEGMICISCAATIKGAIKKMEGVFNVEVNLENRTARVTYLPAKLAPDRIIAVINKLGYKAGAPRDAQ